MTTYTVGDFEITVTGEITAPNIATDCTARDCDEHYVVRIDSHWVRAFHNEYDAKVFARAMAAIEEAKS